MTIGRLVVALGALLLLGGCRSSPMLSQAQMDALQVREIEAPADRAFAAASNAVIDAGYLVRVSDADSGVLTAEFRKDPAVAANVATIIGVAILSMGHVYYDLPPEFHGLCLQVLPDGAHRSRVRIRSFVNAQDLHEPEKVEQIWTLMQRQVLMRELPPGS